MKAINKILFFLFLSFYLHAYSQQIKFQKTFGTSAYDGVGGPPTPDGGYIMSGGIMVPPIIIQNFIMKTDFIGDSLWTKTYESPNPNLKSNLGVFLSKDGGYFIPVGFFIGGNIGQPDHYCLIKTDSNGDTVWAKRVVPGNVMYENADGTYTVMAGMHDLWKVDSGFNNILFGKKYYGYSQMKWMEPTEDGGYIIYGNSQVYASGGAGDRDLYVVKTDSMGSVQWSHSYGTTNMEYLAWGNKCIQQTNDKGYIFTGTTDVASIPYILVVKIDSSGNLQWSKTYGGGVGGVDLGVNIRQVVGAIGYILLGITRGVETVQSDNRTLLARLDGTGNLTWAKMYGSVATNPLGNDWASIVENTNNGGFVLSGGTETMGAGDWDGWLIKTDVNGVSGCNEISTSPTVLVPNIIVGAGGIDSSETPGIITNEGPLVIGTWQMPDSFLCSSIITGVNEYGLENLISLYPNPTSGLFSVSGLQSTVYGLEIYNVFGECIHQHISTSAHQQIDLREAPDGIYFVKIETEQGMISKKVVVMR
ncbi:MAG: T9SS type A sorting domain-containing protein [Bacteroidetes bacterium]|nr:T9SS type A sorting domain-containing protein [Bacteroidota bacterium]